MIKGGEKTKTNIEIAREWDFLAEIRAKQLINHEDLSMDHVLHPLISNLSKSCDFSNVIDLGCGTGYTTNYLKTKCKNLTGIDISNLSIEEAKRHYPKINFINKSIEDFSSSLSKRFSLAFANMTFMDTPNLEQVIKCTNFILNEQSHLILTITHPYFWPMYWGYHKNKWFKYTEEIEIEANFNISLIESTTITTHFHRPLEMYINLLITNGFEIEELREPLPSKEIIEKYPAKWEYPRFIGLRCKKTKTNNT